MRVSDTQTTIILADPPWPHANGSRTNSGKSPKYPLMNLREIAALGPAVMSLKAPLELREDMAVLVSVIRRLEKDAT